MPWPRSWPEILVGDGFTFRRPDGTTIHAMAPVDGRGRAIEHRNRNLGLQITDLTGIPDWDGTPPDYAAAIEGLHLVSAETKMPRPAGAGATRGG